MANHAPWCSWSHEGPCPAENEREQTVPVSLAAKTHALLEEENRRLREALERIKEGRFAGIEGLEAIVDRALALEKERP